MSAGTVPTTGKKQATRASGLWALWVLPCVGVAGYAVLRYLILPPSQGHFAQRLLLLQVHAGGGALALLTGPWQFRTRLRDRYRQWHRWSGRIFLLSVGASSLAGLILSFYSQEGWATHSGFALLAVIWFSTGWMGYRAARAGRFQVHRQWVVRCFALALAAVTLRIQLPLLLFVAHSSFHAAYIAVSWLSWMPNLLFAEWWLSRTRRSVVTPPGSVPGR